MCSMPADAREYPFASRSVLRIRPQDCSTHGASMQRLDNRRSEIRLIAESFTGVAVRRRILLPKLYNTGELLLQVCFIERKKMQTFAIIRVGKKVARVKCAVIFNMITINVVAFYDHSGTA